MSRLYGYEITKDGILDEDELEQVTINNPEPDELMLSLSEIDNEIRNAFECFDSLLSISHLSLENLSERESILLETTIKHISNTLSLEDSEIYSLSKEEDTYKKPGILTTTLDKIYTAILNTLDFVISVIKKFFKWMSDMFRDTAGRVARCQRYLRELATDPNKGRKLRIVFSSSESKYYYVDGSFDPLETISRYKSLLTLFIGNTSLLKNLDNALKQDKKDSNYIDIEIRAIFPVSKKKKHNKPGMFIYKGPYLANGYMLNAVLPDEGGFNPNQANALSIINMSDSQVVKDFDVKSGKIKYDLKFTELEQLVDKLKEISVFNNRIVNYTDKIYNGIDKLRREKRTFQTQERLKAGTDSIKYLSMNLGIISYVLRSLREPFMSLNRMASFSERLLLAKIMTAKWK